MSGLKPSAWTSAEYIRNIIDPVGRVVLSMERTGVPVNPARLREISADMANRVRDLRVELDHWSGRPNMNWNSWPQLSAFLHDPKSEGGLELEPSPYCKKGEVPEGKLSTDDRALEWLAGHNPEHRPGIAALRLSRQCTRMGRYADDWLAAGVPHDDGTLRLHPQFGLASDADTRPGARTGRFGVKRPALNQVPGNPAHDPAGMRSAFVPPPGNRLIVVDYSQLEVVIETDLIARRFGPDDPLVRDVRAGVDIHAAAARFIYGELAGNPRIRDVQNLRDFKDERYPELVAARTLTKSGVYGKNYLKGVHGFATSVFLPDGSPLGKERAQQLVDGLNRKYPGVPQFQNFVRDFIRENRYITSLFNRWFPLPGAASHRVGEFNRAWRQASNWPMQAGGQEIMALAIIAMLSDPVLAELGYVLSLVVHDETVGWAPEKNADAALLRAREIMTTVVELLAPLKASGKHGLSWAEGKG